MEVESDVVVREVLHRREDLAPTLRLNRGPQREHLRDYLVGRRRERAKPLVVKRLAGPDRADDVKRVDARLRRVVIEVVERSVIVWQWVLPTPSVPAHAERSEGDRPSRRQGSGAKNHSSVGPVKLSPTAP